MENIVTDTKKVESINREEANIYNEIKKNIQKLNKSISDVTKDKETLSSSIFYVKRHISQLKEKILQQSDETREFVRKVVEFQKKIKSNKL